MRAGDHIDTPVIGPAALTCGGTAPLCVCVCVLGSGVRGILDVSELDTWVQHGGGEIVAVLLLFMMERTVRPCQGVYIFERTHI